MRMRPHIQALPWLEMRGAEMVIEDEGPDHLPPLVWQRAPHAEASKIAAARRDRQFNRFGGCVEVGERGHGGGLSRRIDYANS
jgi:hypothetical protein